MIYPNFEINSVLAPSFSPCYDWYMKIIRTLDITSDEFYDYLEQELLAIANKDRTGKVAYKPSDIRPGFKATRRTKEEHSAIDLIITDYVRGSCYKAKTRSIAETIEMAYITKPSGDKLEVTFEQEMLHYGQKKMNRFLRGFSDAIYLSRMSNALYDMQTAIVKART